MELLLFDKYHLDLWLTVCVVMGINDVSCWRGVRGVVIIVGLQEFGPGSIIKTESLQQSVSFNRL